MALVRDVAGVTEHSIDSLLRILEGLLDGIKNPEGAVMERSGVGGISDTFSLESHMVVLVKAPDAFVRVSFAEFFRPEVGIGTSDHLVGCHMLGCGKTSIYQQEPVLEILNIDPIG